MNQNMPHEFLTTWAAYARGRPTPPYVLPGDEAILEFRSEANNLNLLAQSAGLVTPPPKFHLDLVPTPFVGDVARAPVVVLLLNPGFAPIDYYAQTSSVEFRDFRWNTLKGIETMHLGLNPEFAWCGAFQYWIGKFRGCISEFSRQTGHDLNRSLLHFAENVAALELVPYGSPHFSLPRRIQEGLRSVQLARAFVNEELAVDAAEGSRLLVVTRKVREWGLEEASNIVCYGNSEARSAHLTPGSRGGGAILKFLLDRA